MAMRRLITICLLALSAVALLATAPVASAAKKKAKPQITRVTPMRISVGNLLTIRGRNFKPKAKGNTVIFRASNGRTAFAKPRRASRRKLVVRVPAAVARLLTVKNGDQRPTRLKLRVLAGRFSKYTSRRLSPVVTGVRASDGGDAPLAACNSSADHDGDLLFNSFELAIKTDPCLRDTDKDGIEDGYEYQSALDLNHYPVNPPLPYPGKRPYPNALDPADASTDYDGDGLQQREEFAAWIGFSSDGVGRSGRPGSLAGLTYSDGLQSSITPFAAPSDALAAWVLDQDGNGQLADDERDADGDALGNWDEQHGRFIEPWWPAQHDGQNEPKESKYPDINFLDVGDLADGLALVVADMDGDGIVDGFDDHDRDGLSNQFEINRPLDWEAEITGSPPPNPWAYVNPFNPCKPFRSSRCHAHPPFGYYSSDEVPPIGPDPPAGYPGGAPPTPAG
jgi:hypothetical protein